MTSCPNCRVELLETTNRCPICQKYITAPDDAVRQTFYPQYSPLKIQTIQRFTFKLTVFITLAIISLMTAFQLLLGTAYFWANLVSALAIYSFVLVNHTIMSQVNPGFKIVVQVISSSIVLFFIDYMNGARLWSTTIIIPVAIIGAVITILIILNVQKMQWNSYIRYLLALFMLVLIPIPLIIFQLIPWLWLALAAIIFALFTLLGVTVLSNKSLKDEFIRRFHF